MENKPAYYTCINNMNYGAKELSIIRIKENIFVLKFVTVKHYSIIFTENSVTKSLELCETGNQNMQPQM